MDVFEKYVVKQKNLFEARLYKSSKWGGWTKGIQQKMDGIIPKRVHQTLATALEKGIKGFLQGVNLLTKERIQNNQKRERESLHSLTEETEKIIKKYKGIASVEGAGTGLGGIISSSIDFPALISIKLKMLQEIALQFGYQMSSFEERLYVIKVLQLQFSGQEVKQRTWAEIKNWEASVEFNEWESWENFNWEEFYMEYKQSIELAKLFQIIPGFGAIVGALANYSFLDELGKAALLCYQLRYIQEKYGELD